jgi:alkaline phosphatase D
MKQPMKRLLVFAFLAITPAAIRAGDAPVARIAFGSCVHQDKPQPIWDTIVAARPDLFLMIGDNLYHDVIVDKAAGKEEPLAAKYAKIARQPGFMKLKQLCPVLATWDDHDYGKNDAGADFSGRHEAQRLFLQFWNVPLSDPRHTRDGVYHARTFGPDGQRIQVILLDTRFFRSPLKPTDQRGAPGKERYLPDDDPAKTMLGEEQWTWLAARLREPAEVRLIVSSIQVLADGHGWERWGNFPRERQRLYDLIRTTGANGVVLLSGDRHIGGLYREAAGVPYPLVEITSSGINQVFPGNQEPGPNRLGAVYGAANFGTVDVDWWEGSLTLSLRGESGEPVRRTVVRLDELRQQVP